MKTFAISVLTALLFAWLPAHATVWYVHPDSALNSIQVALDSCAEDDTVLVGPGTYLENIVWPNIQGVDLMSELGPETTILDGGQAGRVIACTTGMDAFTVIRGFTIRNGYADKGAGIYCTDSSSPTIRSNTICHNEAYTPGYLGGGGILCEHYSSPLIEGNTITMNTAPHWGGGIFCESNASPSITGNTIRENTAETGAAIACSDGSNATISRNTIEENAASTSAGGIFCVFSSSGSIYSNVIRYNTAGNIAGGIFCSDHSSPFIFDNIITYNTAGVDAGGISCSGYASPIIRSNDISHNEGTLWHRGGITVVGNCSPTIDSCNISNNIGNGITIYAYCTAEIHYNDIVNNVGFALECWMNAAVINAEYNWWGDSTGPYHPFTNPGGLGDTVIGDVDFTPWLTGPVGVQEDEVKEIKQRDYRATIIAGPLRLPEGKKCRVFDITGRVVAPDKIRPGIYFIEVDGVVIQKVVKVR